MGEYHQDQETEYLRYEGTLSSNTKDFAASTPARSFRSGRSPLTPSSTTLDLHEFDAATNGVDMTTRASLRARTSRATVSLLSQAVEQIQKFEMHVAIFGVEIDMSFAAKVAAMVI